MTWCERYDPWQRFKVACEVGNHKRARLLKGEIVKAHFGKGLTKAERNHKRVVCDLPGSVIKRAIYSSGSDRKAARLHVATWYRNHYPELAGIA